MIFFRLLRWRSQRMPSFPHLLPRYIRRRGRGDASVELHLSSTDYFRPGLNEMCCSESSPQPRKCNYVFGVPLRWKEKLSVMGHLKRYSPEGGFHPPCLFLIIQTDDKINCKSLSAEIKNAAPVELGNLDRVYGSRGNPHGSEWEFPFEGG